MQNKIIFILSLALLVAIVLLWRSCNKPDIHEQTEHQKRVDSLVQRAIADSIAKVRLQDSANKKIAILSHQKDSLENILAVTKGSLKGKDKDIQGLIDEINKAESSNNLTEALIACDSLKTAYPIARGLVTQYITTNDSLRKANNAIISQKDTIIGRLNGFFTDANNRLFEVSRLYGLQGEDLKKAQKNANKRFSVGPVVGGGIGGGKLSPFIGIGVTYSFIKF